MREVVEAVDLIEEAVAKVDLTEAVKAEEIEAGMIVMLQGLKTKKLIKKPFRKKSVKRRLSLQVPVVEERA